MPGYPRPRYYRGEAYAKLDQIKEAVAAFDVFISRAPKNPDGYLSRGEVYKLMGKKAEAIADFERFIALVNSPSQKEQIPMVRKQIEELSK